MGGCARRLDVAGGVRPPSVTVLMKPDFWSWCAMLMCSFVAGIAVVPRRAREAFWRCEQTWARLTRDMVFL